IGGSKPLDDVTSEAVNTDILSSDKDQADEKTEENENVAGDNDDVVPAVTPDEGIVTSADEEQQIATTSDTTKDEQLPVAEDTKVTEDEVPAPPAPLSEDTTEPTSILSHDNQESTSTSTIEASHDPVTETIDASAGAGNSVATDVKDDVFSNADATLDIASEEKENVPLAAEPPAQDESSTTITQPEEPAAPEPAVLDAEKPTEAVPINEAPTAVFEEAIAPSVSEDATSSPLAADSTSQAQPITSIPTSEASDDAAASNAVVEDATQAASEDDLVKEQAEVIPELRDAVPEKEVEVASEDKGEDKAAADEDKAVFVDPESKVVDALPVAPDATDANTAAEGANPQAQHVAPVEAPADVQTSVQENDTPAEADVEVAAEEIHAPVETKEEEDVKGEEEDITEVKEEASEEKETEAHPDTKVVDALATAPDTVVPDEAPKGPSVVDNDEAHADAEPEQVVAGDDVVEAAEHVDEPPAVEQSVSTPEVIKEEEKADETEVEDPVKEEIEQEVDERDEKDEASAPVSESLPETDSKVIDAVPAAPDVTAPDEAAEEPKEAETTVESHFVHPAEETAAPIAVDDRSLAETRDDANEETPIPVSESLPDTNPEVIHSEDSEVIQPENPEGINPEAIDSVPIVSDTTVPDDAIEESKQDEEVAPVLAEESKEDVLDKSSSDPVFQESTLQEDVTAEDPVELPSSTQPEEVQEPVSIVPEQEESLNTTVAETNEPTETTQIAEEKATESHQDEKVVDALPTAPDTAVPDEEQAIADTVADPEQEASGDVADKVDETALIEQVETAPAPVEEQEPVQDRQQDDAEEETAAPVSDSLPETDSKVIDALPTAPDTVEPEEPATDTNAIAHDAPFAAEAQEETVDNGADKLVEPADELVAVEPSESAPIVAEEQEAVDEKEETEPVKEQEQPEQEAVQEHEQDDAEKAAPAPISESLPEADSKVLDAIPAVPDTTEPGEAAEDSKLAEDATEGAKEDLATEVSQASVEKDVEDIAVDETAEQPVADIADSPPEAEPSAGELEPEDEEDDDGEGDGEEPIIPPRPRRLTVSVTIEQEIHVDEEVAQYQPEEMVEYTDARDEEKDEGDAATAPTVSQDEQQPEVAEDAAPEQDGEDANVSLSNENEDAKFEHAEAPAHLAVAEDKDVERPKSPWTPSYSVTSQGPGVAPEEEIPEIESLSEEAKPAEEAAKEVPTLNIVAPAAQRHEGIALEDKVWSLSFIVMRSAKVVCQLAQTAAESPRPTSPWTPSYSVSRQGSPAPPAAEETPKDVQEASTLEDEKPALSTADSNVAEKPETPSLEVTESQDAEPKATEAVGGVPEASMAEGAQEAVAETEAPEKTEVETSEPQQDSSDAKEAPIDTVGSEATAQTSTVEETAVSPAVEVFESHEEPDASSQLDSASLKGSDAVENADDARPASPWPQSYSVAVQGSPQPPTSTLPTDEVGVEDVRPDNRNPEEVQQPVEEPSVEPAKPRDIQPTDAAPEIPPAASDAAEVADIASDEVLAPQPPAQAEESSTATEAPAASAETESKSLWTPSYSVSKQGADITGDLAAAPSSKGQEAGEAKVEDVPVVAPVPVVADAAKSNKLTVDTSATSADNTPQRPRSPWTPSYSVMRQGAGSTDAVGDEAEIAKLEQLPAPQVPVMKAPKQPEAPAATENKELEPFPTSESYEEEGSLTSLDTVTDSRDTPSSPGGRSRLESTASSLMFPGGWFTKSPTGRASFDNARGEFIPNKPKSPIESTPVESTPEVSEDSATPTNEEPTPVAEPTSPTTEKEKRSKWCIIM
ncbi:hypothetical protein V5O48_016477, partial [Marasmius crinis-equi]